MFWRGQADRSRRSAAFSRLAIPALVVTALLTWTPGALAEAYPDAPIEYVAPVCLDDAAPATVSIYGGDVTNTTTLDLSADGGTAIGDSSGGDDNLATTGGDKKDNDKKAEQQRRQ